MMNLRKMIIRLLVAVVLVAGCSPKAKPAQLSGKVTFKGQPVPAGFISFTPDVVNGNKGQVRVLQIKDGVYDSAKETPPGINPGAYFVQLNGFDGKKIPMFWQGKQIFNQWKDIELTVPEGSSIKDFDVPASLGENVKFVPTSDT